MLFGINTPGRAGTLLVHFAGRYKAATRARVPRLKGLTRHEKPATRVQHSCPMPLALNGALRMPRIALADGALPVGAAGPQSAPGARARVFACGLNGKQVRRQVQGPRCKAQGFP